MRKILTNVILFLWAIPCLAAMPPVLKLRVGTPPSVILKKIITTNQQAPAARPLPNRAPYITWLADSDNRLEPTTILPAMGNHVYSVRNLANQLLLSQGSIDFGINILHTPILLITGNSDNEAITRLLNNPQALPPTIRAELDHLLLPWQESQGNKNIRKQPLAAKVLALVEKNVDFQTRLALKRYEQRLKADRLLIVGAVYDLSNQYGHGIGRLQIININGITKPAEMRRLPCLRAIPPSLLPNLGRQRTTSPPRH